MAATDATDAAGAAGRPALRLRTKLSYAGCEVGGQLLYTGVNTWLLYYLVNVVRLRPLAAGLAFIVGRVVDAALDPVVGELSDRPSHRVRRLSWARWGMVPLAFSFVALWWLPTLGGLTFLLAVLGFVLLSVTFTAVHMPVLALTPILAPSYDERTSLTSYRMALSVVVALVAVAAPPVLVLAFSGSSELAASSPGGWIAMGAAFGLASLLGYALVVTGAEEPPPIGTRASEPFTLRSVTTAFEQRTFRTGFVLFMLVTVALMIANSLLPFFFESVLGLSAAKQTLTLGALFGTAVVAIPGWAIAAEHVGKARAFVAGLVVQSAGLLGIAGLQPGIAEAAVFWPLIVLNGIGVSAVMFLPWTIIPDVVEFDELATGRRREGLLYSLFTFGQKLAGSIGVFATAIVATVFGYQEGTASQGPTTVRGLALAIGPLTAVVYGLAIVVLLRLRITRDSHAALVRTLEERRAPG
jgi:glycoside/pentoside/hexuronide:cation symporter, GPH family